MASRRTTLTVVAALLGASPVALGNGKGGKGGKGDDGECLDTGYEVWQRQGDAEDIGMRIDTTVDSATCTYEIKMTFNGTVMDELGIPFMNDVTFDNFNDEFNVGSNMESDYAQTCLAEGLLREFQPGEPKPWNFPEGNVGTNEYYTDYGWTVNVPKKTRKATGFEAVTLGASPCGTYTQQFPHYSVHFYTVTTDFRKTMTCNSEGGYFCFNATDQCSEAGLKMNTDGVGIPRCEDGTYANTFKCDPELPPGAPFTWTLDANLSPLPGNAATPAMGLHGTCPSEFVGKDQQDPFLLMVQYDKKVIGNHAVFWSGFGNGMGLGSASGFGNEFTWDTEYNCLDENHQNMPTMTKIEYDEGTGLTTTTISGPALSCKKDISETTYKEGKGSKMGKSGKGDDDDECLETGYEVWQRQGDEEDIDLVVDVEVDSDTCTYTMNMTFDGSVMDEIGVPFMNDVTFDNFFTDFFVPRNPGSGFASTCLAEGLLSEFTPGEPKPWNFPEGNVGLNTYYTDYGWTVNVPKKARKATGFESVTLGASPCGTYTQPFPHYSVHFYTVDTDFRKTMTCNSEGGYFCLNATDQCGESGLKMNTDGEGIPRCQDGSYANTFKCPVGPNFAWTLDANPSPLPGNAATPAMGLHGTCPSEFSPTKDPRDPYLLMVQYDGTVIGNHAVFYSGFANGQGLASGQGEDGMMYSWSTEYNCLDEKHMNQPTLTYVHYNNETGLTTTSISGPAVQCKKDIKVSSTKKGKKDSKGEMGERGRKLRGL